MAHVDISTGKIYGAKKKSFEWFHEEGHLVFNDKFSNLLLKKEYLFYCWMALVSLSFIFKVFIVLNILTLGVYLFLGLYEEIWCNTYAREKLKSVKKPKHTPIDNI
jgi:hypothetical protein